MDTHSHSHAETQARSHWGGRPYLSFAAQMLISAIAMYLAMYLMIDSLAHFYLNLNMAYMTFAMLAPMGVAMLALMPSMYQNRGLNIALYIGFAVMLVIGIWFTRAQFFIGDAEFLRSMIPHHSGAILMCEQAPIRDPELADLCQSIIRSQAEEIAQMETILRRL